MTILYRFGHGHVDLPRLHALLQDTYWAKGRPLAQVERAVRNSFCATAWTEDDGTAPAMVAFARLVTDFAVAAYLADVIVDPTWRGRGIGSGLVRRLVSHEAVATCKMSLHTKDAQGVYRPMGFEDFPSMIRRTCAPWPGAEAAPGWR
jgi:GNAT superfamily N-acetyltransferase